MIDTVEPIEKISDLQKGILIPREEFELWLETWDWTIHQLARDEFPAPFTSLDEFQLACICADPVLWCQSFLREPEDPDHKDPYNFFDYQKESIRHPGNIIHQDGSEVGKTREIVAYGLYKALITFDGSGLIGAPQQTHLDEIIEAMNDQFDWNPEMEKSRVKWKKHPHHAFYFRGKTHRFKIDFRPSGYDGEAYRGIHARTFAIKDEAAKDKNPKTWTEFWRAGKPSCIFRVYSVPDGDRKSEYYKLARRAKHNSPRSPLSVRGDGGVTEEVSLDSFKHAAAYIKNLEFRLFKWAKTLMPPPFWTPERKQFYIEQYGGEDSPGYLHNVRGEHGDPENTVFPHGQFILCVKDIPEYRFLGVLVDSSNNDVILKGSKYEYVPGDTAPVPRRISMMDTVERKSTFFSFDENGDSDFKRLIRSFFSTVPGLKRGGGDFGFWGDPTELIIKLIHGKRERTIARLQLKHVTYDQQCQAIDALDDIYGPDIVWGTDLGNAGSAVYHDLLGLPQYEQKNYPDRLKGFQFESTTDNVNEDGEPVIDAKTSKPAKITLKELATDILVKKMQNQELEYPPDEDIIVDYTNHTCTSGSKHRIYRKEDDHIIDADRVQQLVKVLGAETTDEFACGSNLRP
jgi:hypothetical protein